MAYQILACHGETNQTATHEAQDNGVKKAYPTCMNPVFFGRANS